jgi:hypothetical protein
VFDAPNTQRNTHQHQANRNDPRLGQKSACNVVLDIDANAFDAVTFNTI